MSNKEAEIIQKNKKAYAKAAVGRGRLTARS
jgi:hypothetical protein